VLFKHQSNLIKLVGFKLQANDTPQATALLLTNADLVWRFYVFSLNKYGICLSRQWISTDNRLIQIESITGISFALP